MSTMASTITPFPKSFPSELEDRILAHIHADGSSSFSLPEAVQAHAQLSLVSRDWCQKSRYIHFEATVIDHLPKLFRLLELLLEPLATLGAAMKSVIIGDSVAYGWESMARGWAADYIDVYVIFHLIPGLQKIHFFPVDHTTLQQQRYLFGILPKLTCTSLPRSITTLALRPEFFKHLAGFFDFIHDFSQLERLGLYGVTKDLIDTIPRFLPRTVVVLKLVEDTTFTARSAAWIDVPNPPPQITVPALVTPEDQGMLKELLYYNISPEMFKTAFDFLKNMVDRPIMLEVAYPITPNASANSPLEASRLYEALSGKSASVTVLDETRHRFGSEDNFRWPDRSLRAGRIIVA